MRVLCVTWRAIEKSHEILTFQDSLLLQKSEVTSANFTSHQNSKHWYSYCFNFYHYFLISKGYYSCFDKHWVVVIVFFLSKCILSYMKSFMSVANCIQSLCENSESSFGIIIWKWHHFPSYAHVCKIGTGYLSWNYELRTDNTDHIWYDSFKNLIYLWSILGFWKGCQEDACSIVSYSSIR